MHFISKRAAVLGVVASLGFAGTAQAEDDTTSVQLTGGGIAFAPAPAFSNFASTALTGAVQSPTTEIADWGVNDARGSGVGYSVSMDATDLVDPLTADAGVDDVTMTGAVLSVTAPTASKDAGNASAAPDVSGANINTSAVIVDADADEGLGAWTYAQDADDLTLAVPANARLGTYVSTISTTIAPTV